jgi:hypothetical protein
MRKITRIIALLLALTMFTSLFIACDDTDGTDSGSGNGSASGSGSGSGAGSGSGSGAGSGSGSGSSSGSGSGTGSGGSSSSGISTVSPVNIIRDIHSSATILPTTASGCSLAVIPDVESKDGIISKFTDEDFETVEVTTVSGAAFETLVFKRKDTVVTMYWNESKNEMRVMWEDKVSLDYLKPTTSTGKGAIQILQLASDRGKEGTNPGTGMCYVIKLSNGHAVIIDSGEYSPACGDNIYKALNKLDITYQRGKYLIDAWIFTHGHYDHIGAFLKFTAAYKDKVTIEAFMLGIPDNPALTVMEGKPDLIDDIKKNYPKSDIINPHGALKYYFGNITLSMLYTPDMYYAPGKKFDFYNDTSFIFKVEGGRSSMMFFGDAGEKAAEVALLSYDSTVFKSDVMQISHHGLNIVPNYASASANMKNIYGYIDADIALLPMGTRSPIDPRNGRYTVLVDWCNANYQSAFFMNKNDKHGLSALTQAYWDSFCASVENGTNTHDTLYGYDGKNIIDNGSGLTTYIASTETTLMATVISMNMGTVKVEVNEKLLPWLEVEKV